MGPGDIVVDGVAALDRAGPRSLSLLASRRYAGAFARSRAGAVLVAEAFEGLAGRPSTRIVVVDPHRAMLEVMARLFPVPAVVGGVDPTARLGPGVILGAQVSVGPHVSIGAGVRLGDRVRLGPGVVIEAGVEIGDDTVVGARVVVGSGTQVGKRVVIKPGAVLGTTGFGYVSGPDGHDRIPHVGACLIGDDVDIGANTCIDRGSLDDTVIGDGTKIDNLVQIGHNVRIGRRCLLMAGVGVAGSTRIGDGVVLAGQVGVAGHLTVGDGVRAAAQAGISGDIPAGATVTGFPARPNREFLRSQAVLYRLVPIVRDLEALVRNRNSDA